MISLSSSPDVTASYRSKAVPTDKETQFIAEVTKSAKVLAAIASISVLSSFVVDAPTLGGSGESSFGPKDAKPDKVLIVKGSTYTSLEIEGAATTKGHDVSQRARVVQDQIQILDLDQIDFSKDLRLKTDRYTIIKRSDSAFFDFLGKYLLSVPTKVGYADFKNIGNEVDAQTTREIVEMLEANKEIKGLTIRINHDDILEDMQRLFKEEQLVERNNIVARVALSPFILLAENRVNVSHGDHYTPMTSTVTLYSNLTGIAAHELGHHQDYKRFDSDWWYSTIAHLPGGNLFKEWQATKIAKNDLLTAENSWQFQRYLIPALISYVFSTYAACKKWLTNATPADSFGEKEPVTPGQTLRLAATAVAIVFGGGLVGGIATIAAGGFALQAAAFIGAAIGIEKGMDLILKPVVPYHHEGK